MHRQGTNRLRAFFFHLAGALITAGFLLPLYWVVVASLRSPGLPPPRAIEWWPLAPHWENYVELFRVVPMGRYLVNTLIVMITAVPLSVLVAALAGFGLSQIRSAWRQRLVISSIMLLLIPGMAIWTLRFHVLHILGLIDSLGALIVPAVAGGSPLFVLLFYWACWRIPPEIYESARLEGANAWTVLWQIARPLIWPTTAAVAVLAFALYWGDFTTPVLYLFRPELYTLPVGLQLVRQMDASNQPLLMAGSVLMIAPVVLVFVSLQRLFLHNLSFSEVKNVRNS